MATKNKKIQLLLMRHAEAAPKGLDGTDHGRPLTEAGKEAAAAVGQQLIDHNLMPHQVIASNAQRTRTTAEIIIQTIGQDLTVEFDQSLYNSGEANYFRILEDINSTTDSLLIVGHNPAVSYLSSQLGGQLFHMNPAQLLVFEADRSDSKLYSQPESWRFIQSLS